VAYLLFSINQSIKTHFYSAICRERIWGHPVHSVNNFSMSKHVCCKKNYTK